MYWKPTLTFVRRPASVTCPGVEARSSSSAALTSTSSRSCSSWFGGAVRAPPRRRRARPARGQGERPRSRRSPARPRAPCRPARRRAPAVRLLVLARGDQRRHPAHRVSAAAVAGGDQQLGVGAHERNRHRHVAAVGKDHLRPVGEALDRREDVVPAPGVEARRMLAQLVQDLVHLERRRQRLDQTVALIVPRGCRARPARGRTRRSTAGPRGGTRASAGRSTAPCRGPAAAARSERSTGRSRTASPRRARRRRAGGARAGASRGGARAASPGSGQARSGGRRSPRR